MHNGPIPLKMSVIQVIFSNVVFKCKLIEITQDLIHICTWCSLVTNLVTNSLTNLSPNLVITKQGDEFVTKFGGLHKLLQPCSRAGNGQRMRKWLALEALICTALFVLSTFYNCGPIGNPSSYRKCVTLEALQTFYNCGPIGNPSSQRKCVTLEALMN